MSSGRTRSGGSRQTKLGKAEVKIGAKFTPFHLIPEVAIGRRNQAKGGALPDVAADALEGLLLDHAQQLALQVQRQFADLVEEQGAAVGLGEGAIARGDGTGEGAALVPEELAAGELRYDGAAIRDH